MNFRQGKSTPCAFYNKDLGVRTVVHGDDFVSEGPPAGLRKFEEMLKNEFEIKTEVLGPLANQVRQLKILNRVVTWESEGITWEPDPRHAEIIVDQLGLKDAKPLKLPGVKTESSRTEKEDEMMAEEVAAVHRLKNWQAGMAHAPRSTLDSTTNTRAMVSLTLSRTLS